MPWTGFPATASTDWSAIAFLNQIIEHVNLKKRVQNNWDDTHPSLLPLIAVGDDVQLATFIAGLQEAVEDVVGKGDWVATYKLNGAYAPVTDWEGATSISEVQFWTFAPDIGDHANWIYICESGSVLHEDGWLRQYGRTFSTLASTVYTDGDAFVNGHRARCLADWLIYDRVGGAWVLNTAVDDPDIVTAYGQFEIGDYIWQHLWNEMYAVLEALIWIHRSPVQVSILSKYGATVDGGPGEANLTAAKLDAETEYAASTPAAVGSSQAYAEANNNIPGSSFASLFATETEFSADCQEQLASSVDFYVAIEKNGSFYADSDQEFDDFGLGLDEGLLTILGTEAKGAATLAVASPTLGNFTQPTWPVGAEPQLRGWVLREIIAIEKPSF